VGADVGGMKRTTPEIDFLMIDFDHAYGRT
jgi:hypothetical protein